MSRKAVSSDVLGQGLRNDFGFSPVDGELRPWLSAYHHEPIHFSLAFLDQKSILVHDLLVGAFIHQVWPLQTLNRGPIPAAKI